MTTDPTNFPKVSLPGTDSFATLGEALPVGTVPAQSPWRAARPSRIQRGREYPTGPMTVGMPSVPVSGEAFPRLTQGAEDLKLPREKEALEEPGPSRFNWAIQSLGATHPVVMLVIDWMVPGVLAIASYHLAFLAIIAHLAQFPAQKRSLLIVAAITAAGASFQILINRLRENDLPRLHLRLVCLALFALSLLDAGQIATTVQQVFATNRSTVHWLDRFAYIFSAIMLFWGLLMYRLASRLSLRYDHGRVHVAAYHKLARQLRNALLK